MPHWNDAPTGQVPAILDRGNGDEQAWPPPSWREEDTDWAAHEELSSPPCSPTSVPAVGSMMNNNNDLVDMERQPWRFDPTDLPDDDTLVIVESRARAGARPVPVAAPVAPAAPVRGVDQHWTLRQPASVPSPSPRPIRRLAPPVSPPHRASERPAHEPPERRGAERQAAGRHVGRNMQLAWGSGLLLGVVVAALCPLRQRCPPWSS